MIAGVHLVFQAKHENKLYDAFNVPRTQKLDPTKLPTKRALLIACDTLEIYGELSLPEIDVAIYARRLIFKEQGSINTSPLNWTMDHAANFDPEKQKGGDDGAEGRHAGNLAVFVKEIEPSHDSTKRFICRGGRGQHAGLGRKGDNGRSLEAVSDFFHYKQGSHDNYYTASYAHPCVFATYTWKWTFIEINSGQVGENGWPTDGQNALKPGRPGSGGNGGSWVSNVRDLIALLDNTAAGPGDTAQDCSGGTAGTPTTSTHYRVTIHFDGISEHPNGENDLVETKSTKDGKGYKAEASTGGSGKSVAPKTIDIANAWIHPLQLDAVLRYARDAFLAEARDDLSKLLAPYEAALTAPQPKSEEKIIPWTADGAAQWNSAQAEVASMLHRLRTQRDYFGNPAGYMPFLSLQATMRLYDLETKDALRTLLLATWVADESNKAQSAANAFGSAIEQTNNDTARVAEQLVQSEARMVSIDQELTSLVGRLEKLSTELQTLRTELEKEAADNTQKKANIKFGIKMAAAICQVIPVGQPVLGTIGKLATFAADIKEEGTPDTLSKIGDTITKAREGAGKGKTAKAEAANKAAKVPATPTEAKERASAWAKAGDGLGPALSMAGEAIGALHVPEEEIEAELAKLIAASEKWKKKVEEIRVLNKDKTSLFNQLSEVLQAIGDGYARLASNADSLVTMHTERDRALGKLSPEANQVIARLGQTARLSLQRTLYLLVKSYETTVFKTIDVDWNLDKVLDKITELLKPDTGFNPGTVAKLVDDVAPLFEANQKTIKQSLLKDYGFADMSSSSLEFGFTSKETPEILSQLVAGDSVVIDPLLYGLILPTQERAKAISFECKITFKDSEPRPPESGNAILSLRTDGDGTVRRGEHLYAVRSDAPRLWKWTYHFSDGRQQPSVPSISSLDLLNLLLDTTDAGIKQKLAAPPGWSDLTINLEFSPPLLPENRPLLESLMFVCTVESVPAPSQHRILDVRAGGTYERMAISPVDLAGRGDGFGDSYRIYNKAAKVTIKAPPKIGGRSFAYWEVLTGGTHRTDDKPSVDVVLDANALVTCHYQHALKLTAKPGEPVLIRSGAGADKPVIGFIDGGAEPTVLEENAGWRKVAYKGLVGYVAL